MGRWKNLDENIDEILELFQSGKTYREIGEIYGCSKQAVNQIVASRGKRPDRRNGGASMKSIKKREKIIASLEAKREKKRKRRISFVTKILMHRVNGKSWTEISSAVGWGDALRGTSLPGYVRNIIHKYDLKGFSENIFTRDENATDVARYRLKNRVYKSPRFKNMLDLNGKSV